MNKVLVIRSNSSDIDFALLKEGRLVELYKETHKNKLSIGDVFLAKVRKSLPGLNASFINIGHEKDGFLHYHDLGINHFSSQKFFEEVISGKTTDYLLKNFQLEKILKKEGTIKEVLSNNQKILVQVVKEPISTKGPRLNAEISLAGRYIVMVPFSNKISISQKIESNAEKNRLKRLVKSIRPKNFGIIVRTVAQDTKVADIDIDLQNLLSRWENMCKKLTVNTSVPSKILSEINRSNSILRDIFDDHFTGIYCNDASQTEEIQDYLKVIAPEKQEIVKHYKESLPIFEKFGIENQIKGSFGKVVTMKKGSYLVIEHTEALHVIDVNSGNRATKLKSQEETALEVNLLTAVEVARQLKLRDMGGIIVVDFIDLNSHENWNKVYDVLKSEMSTDRAKHKILPASKFGLIQITRQRVRPEMNIVTLEPNPNPNGQIEAPIVQLNKMNHELVKMLKINNKRKIELHLHPFIAAYLVKGFPSIRMKWYMDYKKWVKIVPRHSYQYLYFRFYFVKK